MAKLRRGITQVSLIQRAALLLFPFRCCLRLVPEETQPNTPINLINLIKDPATARIVVCIQINPAPCTHPQPMQRHTPPYIFKFNYAHVTCCIFIINLSNSSLVYFLSQSTCLNKSTCLTQSLKRKSLPEPSALTLGTFVVSWRWLQRGISSASLLHHTTVAT